MKLFCYNKKLNPFRHQSINVFDVTEKYICFMYIAYISCFTKTNIKFTLAVDLCFHEKIYL